MKQWPIVLLAVFLAVPVFAENEDGDGIIEEGEDETAELAKAAQNPIADMISLPFQWNINFDTGPGNHTASALNVQPVYPINLSDDWNLITRTIIPIVNQQPVAGYNRQEWELGNTQVSGFFSPRDSDGFIWGFGPIFEFPTHTKDVLASDNYSAGPTFVALKMEGPWVVGGLWNQLWSFSGDDSEVSKMLIQPIINYNMDDGWYLVSSPIITADWKADSSDQWTIPLGGGLGKIIRIGKLPLNVSTQAFYHVESPEHGAEWSARFQLQFLFPK